MNPLFDGPDEYDAPPVRPGLTAAEAAAEQRARAWFWAVLAMLIASVAGFALAVVLR